jgi:type IV secretion system protein VirB9
MKLMALFTLLLSLTLNQAAFAEKQPKSGTADPRIKSIVYHPSEVVRIHGHYGYQTLIRLNEDEKIQNITIGDSLAWQIIPNQNRNLLFVKPMEDKATTNLTVVTDKRIYTFILTAHKAHSRNHQGLTFQVIFKYPEEEMNLLLALEDKKTQRQKALISGRKSSLPDWNFDYQFSGDKIQVPKRVFDDGEFTYFEFAKMTDVPAIFLVGKHQKESLVNYTTEGRYVVVHRVGRQFTLRNGDIITCILNRNYSNDPGLDLNSPTEINTEEEAS